MSGGGERSAETDALDRAARDGAPERPAIDCGGQARDWCKASWGDVCVLHTRNGDGRPHVWPPSSPPESPSGAA